jgi:hypothetical protein
MKYLKSDSYYSNLYDKFTVEECRIMEKHFSEVEFSKDELKKFSKEEVARGKNAVFRLSMYFAKGERFSNKEKTIREWREEDVKKDSKLEKAEPLKRIYCLKCENEMDYRFKNLWEREEKEAVLFFYECSNCSSRRSFYEDGEEYRVKKKFCKKCGSDLNVDTKRKGNLLITKLKCSDCGTEEIDKLDLSEKKKPIDKNFLKDRERFCLTEKEGAEYLSQRENIKRMSNFIKENKEKDKKKDKKKVKQLKIFDVQKILIKAIEKEDYSDAKFGEPEIKKDVVVGFTVYDKKTKRDNYDSRMQLKKLIENSLKGTNWNLMSDGVNYKLGILSGRLRGKDEIEINL